MRNFESAYAIYMIKVREKMLPKSNAIYAIEKMKAKTDFEKKLQKNVNSSKFGLILKFKNSKKNTVCKFYYKGCLQDSKFEV